MTAPHCKMMSSCASRCSSAVSLRHASKKWKGGQGRSWANYSQAAPSSGYQRTYFNSTIASKICVHYYQVSKYFNSAISTKFFQKKSLNKRTNYYDVTNEKRLWIFAVKLEHAQIICCVGVYSSVYKRIESSWFPPDRGVVAADSLIIPSIFSSGECRLCS